MTDKFFDHNPSTRDIEHLFYDSASTLLLLSAMTVSILTLFLCTTVLLRNDEIDHAHVELCSRLCIHVFQSFRRHISIFKRGRMDFFSTFTLSPAIRVCRASAELN